jgi:hypothetical protein
MKKANSRTSQSAKNRDLRFRPEEGASGAAGGGKRTNFTVSLPAALQARARAAAYYTPGENLSGLTERALKSEIERMERERGAAFPDAAVKVKTGRPISVQSG